MFQPPPDPADVPEQMPAYTPEPDSFETLQTAMEWFAKKVRSFMQDETEINELLGKREFSWDSIYTQVEAALSDWNTTPPVMNTTVQNFPKEARFLIYRKAAIELLRSAANPQARNNLNYSDQGWAVQESDKAPMYLQIAGGMEAMYEERKIKYKAAQNAAQMWGGMWSDAAYGGYDEFGGPPYL